MMKKTVKRIVCTILSFAIVLSSVLLYNFNLSKNDYIDDLTGIYKEYDNDISESQKAQKFGYRRLIVTDYDGNDYNASKVAYDSDNDIAILQYENVESTVNAYNQMLNNGVMVEPDSNMEIAQAKYEKCQMSPEHSQLMQIPQYLNNYKMKYDDVLVGVIDTGVMLNHTDLKDRFVSRGYDLSSDNNNDADYVKFVDVHTSLHATMVSGIIANNTPDSVKILPIKVVAQGSRSTTASAIISAINLAISNGCKVINISISGPGSGNAFSKTIENAKNKGVCVCVCTGNENSDIDGIFPASVPQAFTVGAINNDKIREEYSNYGSEIDFVAPGNLVTSCAPDENGNSSYMRGSGTSYASPFVVAAVANISSINSQLSNDEIYNFLLSRTEDLGQAGRDIYYGNGLIQMGDYTFSDTSYTYRIPQGTLEIFETRNYTESTQPWRLFNDRIKEVTISDTLTQIGDYNFYNMSKANFKMPNKILSVGKYAFSGCNNLAQVSFPIDVAEIGTGAFSKMASNFVINGYNNTPAQTYAKAEGITFNSLGCNHNYLIDVVEPTPNSEGYTIYTCSVCGEVIKEPYRQPKLVLSGKCGDNLSFELFDIGKLVISGSGDMYQYLNEPSPWIKNGSDIKVLEIANGVNSISPFAFYGCNNLVKINNYSDSYDCIDGYLYSKDLTQLVLYAGGINNDVLEIKDSVLNIKPESLICANKISDIKCNSSFKFIDNIIYDVNDNIVLFMPYYSSSKLIIDKPITVKANAMILCDSIDVINVEHPNAIFEQYSIGYKYNGVNEKRNITIYGCYKSNVEAYALENGFNYISTNSGYCGKDIRWVYDELNNELHLIGSGDMYNYASLGEIPWGKFLPKLNKLIIDENIYSLSDYAFYNAKNLTGVVMPLSVKCCPNDTTWYNCSNIKSLHLTYGTGYMDDYGTDFAQILYSYVPWHISRNSITDFYIDPSVKYIGSFAFRNCLEIKKLTLLSCQEIGKFAFVNNPNLMYFRLESKDTIIGKYSIFSYEANGYHFYNKSVLYGYVDSTAQAYAQKYSVNFSPIGCSHFVKGTLVNNSDQAIENALFYMNDILSAKTNQNGQFIVPNLKCGSYSYKLVYNGLVLTEGNLDINHTNYKSNIKVSVGDYVADGVINTKDFAEAEKMGYRTDNIDLGKTFSIKPASFVTYDVQKVPCITSIDVNKDPNSNTCYFTAYKDFNSEFNVTECGFLFGSSVPDDFMILENVGKSSTNSGKLRQQVAPIETYKTTLPYALSSGKGTMNTRFYVKYSNGVNEYLYYSDCASYTYL